MGEGAGNDKSHYVIDGEDWAKCNNPFDTVIDELAEHAPQLLGNTDHAKLIRQSFRAFVKPEGIIYSGIFIRGGSCFWLHLLRAELMNEFKHKTVKTKPQRWCEMSKGVKREHYKDLHKQVVKMVGSLEKMRLSDDELLLSAITKTASENDTSIIELLTALDDHISKLSHQRSTLEKYIDSDIRKSKKYIDSDIRGSKPVSLPVDVRVFVKVMARRLVNGEFVS
ncbi:MAG: hypothetical protein L3K52_15215 [Candidatus Thiothrix sulfatifontis]|nr:MAG: hypothetical protein L3K52_15215 [Candidatus Thiothrix sulfatifontis]